MSNLKNNTTQLEALLAKVNALPEAGGTSGGSSIETCTVTLLDNGIFHYTDENMTLQSVEAPASITVVKNTIVGVVSGNSQSPLPLILDGYCQEIVWSNYLGCVVVNGDCSMTVGYPGSGN